MLPETRQEQVNLPPTEGQSTESELEHIEKPNLQDAIKAVNKALKKARPKRQYYICHCGDPSCDFPTNVARQQKEEGQTYALEAQASPTRMKTPNWKEGT